MKKFLYLCIAVIWIGYIVWKKTRPEEVKELGRPVPEVIAGQLVNHLNQSVKLKPSAYYLIYFAAHWCPPCREFTPKLADAYKKMKKGDNVNVIFVSGDRTVKEMCDYMKVMPWYAVKFNGVAAKELYAAFGEKGIPNLVVVNRAGKAIYRSYADGEYLGPHKALKEFQQHLKDRPVVVKAIDMAKDIQAKRLGDFKDIESVSKAVKTKSEPKQVKSQPKQKATKAAVARKETSVDNLSGYTLNGIAGNATKRGAIINGKIYYAGDEVWDDIVVKEVRDKEVVLMFKGKPVVLKISGFSSK